MLPALAAILGGGAIATTQSEIEKKQEANAQNEIDAAQSEASKIENADEKTTMINAAKARQKALQKEAVKQELQQLLHKFKAEAQLDQKVEEKRMSKEKK